MIALVAQVEPDPAWLEVVQAFGPAVTALLGVLLGYWIAGVQARRNREAAERAQRIRQVGEALADASVLLDRALPDRFALSFNAELSPQLLDEYLDEWRTVERTLAHARLVAATTPGDREKLFQVSRSIGVVLHRLQWVAHAMAGHRDFKQMLDDARQRHERAEELIRELAESLPS
jgi:hypothetical protein